MGETLSGLKIEGVPFFAVVAGGSVTSISSKMPKLTEESEAFWEEVIYYFRPKSNRLPHLESEIKEHLSKVQFGIKLGLTKLVGRVVSLW